MTTKALAKHESETAAAVPRSRDEAWSGDALEGLTDKQREEAEAIKAVVLARPLRPAVHVAYNGEGVATLTLGNPDKQGDDVLNSIRGFGALGSSSNAFTGDMLTRIMKAVRLTGDATRDSEIVSGAVALVAAVDPQNELEATMALQMVAANEAALTCFERSRNADWMEHAAPYSTMANKAMRSFALHAEALAKLRRGGEQVVKHVHVNEGGQAVIAGTVNTGGRG
jgi:hypothetical protein